MYKTKKQNWLLLLGALSLMATAPMLAKADSPQEGGRGTSEMSTRARPGLGGRMRPGRDRRNRDTRAQSDRTLTVTGQAEVRTTPDRANVNIGAEAQASDAAQATSQVNEIMNRALASIKKLGINSSNIKTTQVNLYPVYGERKKGDDSPPPVVAYRASNTVQVTVNDLSLVGKVLDAANKAGANRQNGVSFDLQNDTVAKAQALRNAAAEARTKAQALADALGVRLGEVRSANEGGANIIYPRAYSGAMLMARDSASTPVESGEITIQANVTITYQIIQ